MHETIDGEVVLIDLNTGAYYGLDGAGADIWALIETGATTDGIVREVGRRYRGDHPRVEEAVIGLLEELRQEGLITVGETSTAEGVAVPAEGNDVELAKHRFKAPVLRKYTDMQELILLDPIHEVDVTGWPDRKP